MRRLRLQHLIEQTVDFKANNALKAVFSNGQQRSTRAERTDEICILAQINALGDILQCAVVVDAVKAFLALLCEYDQPLKIDGEGIQRR